MGWREDLEKPISLDIGLDEQTRQGIYNLARKQAQGGWGAATEEMKRQLGGRGFRVGESGYADTALGRMYSQGAEQLGDIGRNIALEETQRRFDQNKDLANLNLQRSLGLGGLDVQLAGIGASSGAASAALDWEKEKFSQTFPWEKEKFYLGNMMDIYGGMMGEQRDVYAPYYQSISGGY